jgi:hypothetical protein
LTINGLLIKINPCVTSYPTGFLNVPNRIFNLEAVFVIDIPMKAVGKERPRWCFKHQYAYTPKKTKEFEEKFSQFVALYMKCFE